MNRDRESLLVRLGILGILALAAPPASAISVTPSWEEPEIVDDRIGTNTRGERMRGQDRWMLFDPFGLPGLAIVNGNTEFSAAYLQRLPGVGWARSRSITGGATHATFHYDENGLPELFNLDFQASEMLHGLVDLSFRDFKTRVAVDASGDIEFDRTNSGVATAIDPQGRSAIVYVENAPFMPRRLVHLLDVNGDGRFDDDVSGFATSVGSENVRPSLAIDPQGRSYIGTIATADLGVSPGPVEVFARSVPILFGSAFPDPDVDSTFVSLALNPLTGAPAVAYNDVDARSLKYAEWDGQTWVAETVDTQSFLTAADNMPLSLAFDPIDGRPAIAYAHDLRGGAVGRPPPIDRLKFAWHDGTQWQTQVVDDGSRVASGAVALAFNDAPDGFGDGLPAIAYIAADDTVRFVRDPVRTTPLGDFNLDGAVDAADYTVWRDGLGLTYTPTDYEDWRTNYTGVGSTAQAAGAPEPGSLVLAALAAWGCLTGSRLRDR